CRGRPPYLARLRRASLRRQQGIARDYRELPLYRLADRGPHRRRVVQRLAVLLDRQLAASDQLHERGDEGGMVMPAVEQAHELPLEVAEEHRLMPQVGDALFRLGL